MRLLPSGANHGGCSALEKIAKPSDQDIDTALDGHLCRCGTYLRIRAGIHKAAELSAKELA